MAVELFVAPLDFSRTSSRPPSGVLHVLYRSPRYIRTRLTGRYDLNVANELMSTLDAWRGTRTGLVTFSDCSAMDTYDVAARHRTSTWARVNAPAFEAMHLLVRSRPIAWAAQIFSALSGSNVVMYHSLEAFEAAFARRRDDTP